MTTICDEVMARTVAQVQCPAAKPPGTLWILAVCRAAHAINPPSLAPRCRRSTGHDPSPVRPGTKRSAAAAKAAAPSGSSPVLAALFPFFHVGPVLVFLIGSDFVLVTEPIP